MDFFTKTDVPDEIEAKIKVEHNVESKYEISKDLLFKNEIKKDFKAKTGFEEFKIKMKGDCIEQKDVKSQKFKIEPKAEIEDGEFQNGLRVIENLKCGVQIKVKNEEIKMDPETPMLKMFENNEFINEKKIKPEMFKIKVEPKVEIEDVEFQNGLNVIETLMPSKSSGVKKNNLVWSQNINQTTERKKLSHVRHPFFMLPHPEASNQNHQVLFPGHDTHTFKNEKEEIFKPFKSVRGVILGF